MMSINENQPNNELQGSVKIENAVLTGESASVNETSGTTFEDEFKKLLYDDTESIDASLISAAGTFAPIEYNYEIGETYNYDTDTIDNVDAMFFLKVASSGNEININLQDTNIVDASNYKTMEVSKTLTDLMVKAQENNKALRLDFDNNVTIVLKVSKEGKIDVSFFPQDKKVETYLKNNIDYLKVRFDEQSIAYSNISYKPYRQNRNNSNNNRGNNNE